MLLQQAHECVMEIVLIHKESTTEIPTVNSGTKNTNTDKEKIEVVQVGIEMITEIKESSELIRGRGRDRPALGKDTGSKEEGMILRMMVIGRRGAVWTEFIVLTVVYVELKGLHLHNPAWPNR